MKGYIMQIQPFSVNDGEGIRTNIFMAGCPLRCKWCSNPEGFSRKEVDGWYRRRCVGCGACVSVGPQVSGTGMDEVASGKTWHELCSAGGACADACPENARIRMVSLMDADEVIEEVHRHRIFYSFSGGGVTFSGGEATSQPEFLEYLSRELYDMGYSLALETCGYFEFDRVKDSLERMDLIFIDLKHMDPEVHMRYTGVSNEKILQNIRNLGTLRKKDGGCAGRGPEIVVRIPVIGGVNNSEENISASAAYVRSVLPDAGMELLPYHRLGKIKYEALGMQWLQDDFFTPGKDEMERLRELVREQGVKNADYR